MQDHGVGPGAELNRGRGGWGRPRKPLGNVTHCRQHLVQSSVCPCRGNKAPGTLREKHKHGAVMLCSKATRHLFQSTPSPAQLRGPHMDTRSSEDDKRIRVGGATWGVSPSFLPSFLGKWHWRLLLFTHQANLNRDLHQHDDDEDRHHHPALGRGGKHVPVSHLSKGRQQGCMNFD